MEAHVKFAPIHFLLIREDVVEFRNSIVRPENFRQRGLDALSRADVLVAFRAGIGDVRCDHAEKFSYRAIAKKPRPIYLYASEYIRVWVVYSGKLGWISSLPTRV